MGQEIQPTGQKVPEQGLFQEITRPAPCSWNECTSGHRWPPTVVTGVCPGCNSTMIAFKQENCPFCNEPMTKTSVRADFVPRGTGITRRCHGQLPPGESIDIDLQRNSWRTAEDGHKTFSEKESEGKSKQLSEGVPTSVGQNKSPVSGSNLG